MKTLGVKIKKNEDGTVAIEERDDDSMSLNNSDVDDDVLSMHSGRELVGAKIKGKKKDGK